MALEDVVQSVKVQVEVDGVDEAGDKIVNLKKQIASLSESADTARSGGGAGGNNGIEGLSGAFKNLGMVGADAFSNILSQTTHGEFSGLATMLGGPVAGSVTKVAEQLLAFSQAQDEATLKNLGMAKQFGTTPDIMQGISAAMGEAGVSSQGFERLVTMMSRRVTLDYTGMMRNIRTDNTSTEESALGLKKAQEELSESFSKSANSSREASLNTAKAHERYLQSLGIPKEVFAAQDKLREQQEASLALDKAIQAQHEQQVKEQNEPAERRLALAKAEEAQRQQELKSIPRITAALREGAAVGKQQPIVGETDLGTLMKSVENLARGGKTGPATGIEVFQTLMEQFRTGGIGREQGLTLLGTEMGQRSMGAGGAGMNATRIMEAARSGMFTPEAIKARADQYQKMGLTEARPPHEGMMTPGEQQVTRTESERAKAMQEFSLGMQRINETVLAPISERFWRGTSRTIEAGANMVAGRGLAGGAPAEFTEGAPWWWGHPGGTVAPTPEALKKVNEGVAAGQPPTTAGGGGGGIGGAFGTAAQEIVEGGAAVGEALAALASMITGTPKGSGPQGGSGWPAAQWRGGVIRFARGGLIRRFDVGGGVDPWNIMQSVVPGGGGMQMAAAPDPRAYGIISGAHKDIEEAGFDPVMHREMSNMWDGGFIPGFAGGGVTISGSGPTYSGDPAFYPSDGGGGGGGDFGYSTDDMLEAETSPEFRDQVAAAMEKTYTARGRGAQEAATAAYHALLKKLARQIRQRKNKNAAEARNRERQKKAAEQAGSDKAGAASRAKWNKEWAAMNPDSQGLVSPEGRAGGGFAVHGPGTGTSDSILARVSNGEFVMKAASVRAYGEGFMHALNNMQIPAPKYAMGGLVPTSSLPRLAEGGAVTGGHTTLNLTIGNQEFKGLKAPEAVAQQLKIYALDDAITSTGHKPSWVG